MPEYSIWVGRPLAELWPILAAEATAAGGAWVGRRFPSGASVFLREAGGTRTLRIARATKPKEDRGSGAFHAECRTFLKHFDLHGWRLEEEPGAKGIALRFHEPPPPSGLRCTSCSRPLQANDLLYLDGEHCSSCMSEVPCRKGCGRMASVRKGSFVGICSPCAELERQKAGWAPVGERRRSRPKHRCPVFDCPTQVAEDMVMCAPHWAMVPEGVRKELWRQYKLRPGSRAHTRAVREAISAVERQGEPERDLKPAVGQ